MRCGNELTKGHEGHAAGRTSPLAEGRPTSLLPEVPSSPSPSLSFFFSLSLSLPGSLFLRPVSPCPCVRFELRFSRSRICWFHANSQSACVCSVRFAGSLSVRLCTTSTLQASERTSQMRQLVVWIDDIPEMTPCAQFCRRSTSWKTLSENN